MGVESILGGHEAQLSQSNTNKIADDKQMFLTLLVAQLSNQDPLNPTEDKEFISQLAQFTSLEKLQSINDGMDRMIESNNQRQMIDAVSLVGKKVLSEGYTVVKSGKYDDGTPVISQLFYTNDVPLSECVVTIIESGTGNIVYQEKLGPQHAAEHLYEWNGTNFFGMEVPDGYYDISITGTDDQDRGILVRHEVLGIAYGTERINGELYIILADLRKVKFTDINVVSYYSPASGGSTGDTDDTGSGG